MMKCVFCKARLDETAKTCPNCSKPAYFGVEIEDLQYERLSPSLAEQIVVKGLFNGDLKKFVQCIAEGNAWTIPVIVDETFCYTDDDRNVYCANFSDELGRPCERAVHLLDNNEFGSVIDGVDYSNNNFDDYDPDDDSDDDDMSTDDIAGCDVHAVLLRYQIGKNMRYLLLNTDSVKNLPVQAKKIANATKYRDIIRKCLAIETALTYMGGKVLARFIKMHYN
ncbi:hypothetical protein [uncultured Robinsoniella sp.]|uniref:hypothetical protein n=1 Tax=uncultured Robinsoniella sp. TaxID=904190 RepID=UPI00374E9C42